MRVLLFFPLLVSLLLSCAGVSRVGPGERFIADSPPVQSANIGAGFEKLFSKELDNGAVRVFFHPRTNNASLDYSYQLTKHRLILSEAARASLAEAVAAYAAAYDGRTLNARAKRTDAAFGKAASKLQWGTLIFNAYAYPQLRFGYSFKNPRSPYLTLTVPKTENVVGADTQVDSDDYSIPATLYFTRGQALALAEALKQENLEAAVAPLDIPAEAETEEAYDTE